MLAAVLAHAALVVSPGWLNSELRHGHRHIHTVMHTIGCRKAEMWAWMVQVLLVRHATDYTPPIQPADAPAELFSEERALQHLKVLSVDIGMRRLSTPGLQQATHYLQQQVEALAQLAAETRPDLVVEVSAWTAHVHGYVQSQSV